MHLMGGGYWRFLGLQTINTSNQPTKHWMNLVKSKSSQVQHCRGSKIGSYQEKMKSLNYFTSSDPHHDMLGGGCQVRVVIENMMGRMENLRTLISGFLGLVILVRRALVTMFLS